MTRGNCDFRNVTSHEIPPLARSAIIADGTPAERGWKGRVGAAEQGRGRPPIGDAAAVTGCWASRVVCCTVSWYQGPGMVPGYDTGYDTWV